MEEKKMAVETSTAPILRLVSKGGLQSKSLAHPLMTPHSSSAAVLGPPVYNNLQTSVPEGMDVASLLRLFSLTHSTEALCYASLSSGPPGAAESGVTQAPVGIISVGDILRVGLSIGAWSLQLHSRHGSPPASPLRFKDLKIARHPHLSLSSPPSPSSASTSSASSSPTPSQMSPASRAMAAIGATFRSFSFSSKSKSKPAAAAPTPASAVLSAFTVSQVLASASSAPIASLAADSPLDMLLAMFHKLAPPSHRATQTVFLLQDTPPFHLASAISSRDLARFLHDNVELLGSAIADSHVDSTYEPPIDPATLTTPGGGDFGGGVPGATTAAPPLPMLLDPLPPGGGSPHTSLPPPGTPHPSVSGSPSPRKSRNSRYDANPLLRDVVSASYTLPARDVLRLLHLHQVPAVALVNEWNELVMQLSIRHMLVLATVDEDEAERLMGLPAHAFVMYSVSRKGSKTSSSSSSSSSSLLSEDMPDDRDVLPVSVTFRAALAKFATSRWDHLFLVDQESKPVKSLTVGALVHKVATELHQDREVESMRKARDQRPASPPTPPGPSDEVLGSSDDEAEVVVSSAQAPGGDDSRVCDVVQPLFLTTSTPGLVEESVLSITPAGDTPTDPLPVPFALVPGDDRGDDGVPPAVPEQQSATDSGEGDEQSLSTTAGLPPSVTLPLDEEDDGGEEEVEQREAVLDEGHEKSSSTTAVLPPPLTLTLDEAVDPHSLTPPLPLSLDERTEVEEEEEEEAGGGEHHGPVPDSDDSDSGDDREDAGTALAPLDDSDMSHSGPPLPCLDLEEPVIVLSELAGQGEEQEAEEAEEAEKKEDNDDAYDRAASPSVWGPQLVSGASSELDSDESDYDYDT